MFVDALAALPDSYRQIAATALSTAFGPRPVEALRVVQGGASGALTYRIDVAGCGYLLRVETARDPFRNPHRSYVCMQAAAEAGLAPALIHADPDSGVAIMDFVDQQPLTAFPGGPAALGAELGDLIRRLQATPAFPPLLDYGVVLQRVLEVLVASKRFAPDAFKPHLTALAAIRSVYPWNPDGLVSSHNDLNPGNLLFDGRRLWLIDWEMAFRNDPIADIALASLNFASMPGVEAPMLRTWLGRKPDPVTLARLTVMKAMGQLYYGGVMLTLPRANAPAVDDLAAPPIAEFAAMAATGRLPADHAEVMHLLGKSMLRAFVEATCAEGFEDALALAAAG